jgi:phospholipid N-methyltransferase
MLVDLLPNFGGAPTFDPLNEKHINLAFILGFFVSLMFVGSRQHGPLDHDTFFVYNAVFWRMVYFLVKYPVLMKQRSGWWTNIFVERGQSAEDGFFSWMRILVIFEALSHTSVVVAAFRVFWIPDTISTFYMLRIGFAFLLGFIAICTMLNCFAELGEFGWYYGDFFLKTMDGPECPSGLTYHGIYKYFNNPETYLGHFGHYGLALFAHSWEIFYIAVASHVVKTLFLQYVEKPHTMKLYKDRVRKYQPVIERAVMTKVDETKEKMGKKYDETKEKIGQKIDGAKERMDRMEEQIKENETAMFLSAWVRHPRATGAIAPSSEQLADAVCDTMYLGDDAVVLELGPGTGPFTREIIRRIEHRSNTTFIAFELREEFIQKLQSMFPEHAKSFVMESAENLVPVMQRFNVQMADTIISGLPWAVFPDRLQRGIMKAVVNALKPGGRFCSFAYFHALPLPHARSFRKLLEESFETVEISPVGNTIVASLSCLLPYVFFDVLLNP